MTIQVPFPDDQMAALERKAQSAGLSVEAYISRVVKRDLNEAPTLSEVLAEFREQVAESGLSPNELDALFVDALNEARA